MICHNIYNYVKKYNICLALKIVQHKLYNNEKYLSVFPYCWKNSLIDFVTSLSISID